MAENSLSSVLPVVFIPGGGSGWQSAYYVPSTVPDAGDTNNKQINKKLSMSDGVECYREKQSRVTQLQPCNIYDVL